MDSSATITLHLTGLRPMLMHNGRLANPIDPWTRELKKLTGKRKKTDEDLIAMMRIEARGGAYETADDMLGLPTENVWRSLFDAAKAFKRGVDVKRALLTDGSVSTLLVGGDPVKVDDFLTDPDHIDYRPVRVGQSKTMRARPLVTDWSSTHTFELLTDVIDPRDLEPIVERAGRLVGLGDYRPTYGTFEGKVEA